MTGAERLPERLAQAFEERFGLRPIEGYGATECAPVVAASTLAVRRPGVYQPGSRRGSVGPGSAAVVDAMWFAGAGATTATGAVATGMTPVVVRDAGRCGKASPAREYRWRSNG